MEIPALPDLRVKTLSVGGGWKYLQDRGLNPMTAQNLGFKETDYPGNQWWGNRVYLRITGPGMPDTCVTRAITPGAAPKYLSGPYGGASGCLWYPHQRNPCPPHVPLVLVEGVFDALAIYELNSWFRWGSGPSVDPVAILGCDFHPAQLANLINHHEAQKRLIGVLGDPDRIDKWRLIEDKLRAWGLRVVNLTQRLLDVTGDPSLDVADFFQVKSLGPPDLRRVLDLMCNVPECLEGTNER